MQDGCLNCGGTLMPHQKFCSLCGQKASTRRLSFRQLGREFLGTILHFEQGLLRLVKGLTLQPGLTATEYANGRRKDYFNPFAFMGLCIAVMLFINNWLKPYTGQPDPDPEVLARIYDPALKQLYLDSLERIGRAERFVNKNMNIISVLITPYFAFFLWLFFKRRGRNMAEITVAYILFTAFCNLATTVLLSPFLTLARDTAAYNPVLYGITLLQTLYIAWGMRTFLNYKPGSGYWRVLGVLALAGCIGFILVLIAYFFYVYRGGASTVLQYL